MKRTKFTTTVCSPDGTFNTNKVYEIDDKLFSTFEKERLCYEVSEKGIKIDTPEIKKTVEKPVTTPVAKTTAPKAKGKK